MSRPRHNRPEYEKLLKEAEKRRWRVEGGGSRHFKIKCPNPCKCMTIVSTTPRRGQTMRTLTAQMARATCWEEDK